MIEEFIKKCKENPTKNAFIVGRKKITYSQLLNDLYKMVNLFKSKNLKRGQSVLLFVPPSYHFYLLLFACIYYGINIVVPDSFKDNKRIADIIENHNIEYVFCNNFKTSTLSPSMYILLVLSQFLDLNFRGSNVPVDGA